MKSAETQEPSTQRVSLALSAPPTFTELGAGPRQQSQGFEEKAWQASPSGWCSRSCVADRKVLRTNPVMEAFGNAAALAILRYAHGLSRFLLDWAWI